MGKHWQRLCVLVMIGSSRVVFVNAPNINSGGGHDSPGKSAEPPMSTESFSGGIAPQSVGPYLASVCCNSVTVVSITESSGMGWQPTMSSMERGTISQLE